MVSGLAKGQTKSSLKSGAQTLPSREPVNKRLKKEETVTFSEEDPVPPMVPHSDAIVIEAVVANKLIRRIHIDIRASVNIIFKRCFDQMGIDKSKVMPTARPLRSFVQEETHLVGAVELPLIVGKAPKSSTEVTEFFVVDTKSPYNIILGRTWLNAVRAICSTYHLALKIPTKGGVSVIRGDQKIAKVSLHVALKGQGASPQLPQA